MNRCFMCGFLRFCVLSALLLVHGASVHAYHLTNPPASAPIAEDREIDAVIDELEAEHYAALDARLHALQHAYAQDTQQEKGLELAFNAFSLADPTLEPHFAQWLRRYPDSYAARLAAGIYYHAMGRAWRGGKSAAMTHPERWRFMAVHHDRARRLLLESLPLTTKPTLSYAYLIRIAGVASDAEEMGRWLGMAIERDPYCVVPRDAYMTYLEPRWGGGKRLMRAFAEETGRGGHSKLQQTAGRYAAWIDWYDGFQAMRKGNDIEALNHFNESLAIVENAAALRERGALYRRLGQTDLALGDLERAHRLSPGDGECCTCAAWPGWTSIRFPWG